MIRAALFDGKKWLLSVAVGFAVGGGVMLCGGRAGAADGASDATNASAVQSPAQGTDKAKDAIATAVRVLQKEYSAHESAPEGTPLRTSSDYFSTSPSPDVTEESVVTALGQSLGSNPRADAYIKWQLLSAVSGQFDAKNAQRVLAAFQQHVPLVPRPGATRESKEEMVQAVRGKAAGAAEVLNQELTTAVTKAEAQNKVPLKYLDDLYTKLPASDAVILAGFNEAYNRAEAGIDSTLSDTVITLTRTWVASSSPKAPQITEVREAVHKLLSLMGGPQSARRNADAVPDEDMNIASLIDLDAGAPVMTADYVGARAAVREVVTRTAPRTNENTNTNKNNTNNSAQQIDSNAFPTAYFTHAAWNATQKRLLWAQAKVKFATKKQLQDLEKFLDSSIANPNGGIQFQGPK